MLLIVVAITYCFIGWIAVKLSRPIFFPNNTKGTIGFFHPHSEDGGGGERVLWCCIKALTEARPHVTVVLYTNKGYSEQELKARALRNFNIQIKRPIRIHQMSLIPLLDSSLYPRLTLLLQAISSVLVGIEAMRKEVPEIFFDSTGWAATYPLAWLLGSIVGCYVHYPTISTDMLFRVKNRRSLYNNSAAISSSAALSFVKLMYYRIFAFGYGIEGRFASVVMVNSSWTRDHIAAIWGKRSEPKIVFPPVDTDALQLLPLERPVADPLIISVGQFRPEKNHKLQIDAYCKALHDCGEGSPVRRSRLQIVGSCRNEDDRRRLQGLKTLVSERDIADRVEFFENVPFSELKELLGRATVGLHTMMDEHFGIGVVEYMAAGVIPIAHNSGGPKMDILPSTVYSSPILGFLKTTVEEYSDAITKSLEMDPAQRLDLANSCREKSKVFSQELFQTDFLDKISEILPSSQTS